MAVIIIACSQGEQANDFNVKIEEVEKETGTTFEEVDTSAIETDRTIEIRTNNHQFIPGEIELKLGEKVRFKVISEDLDHGLKIGDIEIGINDVFVADTEMVINFTCVRFCEPEDGMTGSIIIKK